MLLITCPYCGERPEIEFSYGGQAHLVRPANPEALSDQEWAEFLYMRRNRRGVHAERWRHVHGCARFFNALRDTTTDQFLATYRVGESPPKSEAPNADTPNADTPNAHTPSVDTPSGDASGAKTAAP